MLVKVVETPAEVLSALRRNTPLNVRSISEIYQQQRSSLQCVVCSDPASRNGVSVWLLCWEVCEGRDRHA